MNYNWIDKTNMRWGKLAAIKYLEKGKWLCQCDCGKIKFILRKRRILNKDCVSLQDQKTSSVDGTCQ